MTAPSLARPSAKPPAPWRPEPAPEGSWRLVAATGAVASPEGRPLVLPTAALAELVSAPQTRAPALRLAVTAIDRVAAARAAVAGEVAGYAGSDLLCYRADGPETLVERQVRHWGPWLDWAAEALGLPLESTVGIAHRAQSPAALDRARALALELDDFALTGLAAAATLFGSAVLAFALQRGVLTGAQAFDLSRLDEAFQTERWGVDAEAQARVDARAAEAVMLERWLRACASTQG